MLLDRFFAWNILIFIFFLWWTQSLRWHWHPFGPSVRHILTKNERLFKKRFSEEVQAGVESACLFRSRQISESSRLFFLLVRFSNNRQKSVYSEKRKTLEHFKCNNQDSDATWRQTLPGNSSLCRNFRPTLQKIPIINLISSQKLSVENWPYGRKRLYTSVN